MRLLKRGESTVAGSGALFGATVVAAVGASCWWAATLQYQAAHPDPAPTWTSLLGRPGEVLGAASGLAGYGAIASVSLLAVWLAYRHLWKRARALSLVRGALLEARDAEPVAGSLTLPEGLGPETEAWNELISEKERLEKQVLGRKVEEVLSSRQERSGDLDNACDVMRQGLILVDKDLWVTYANGAAAVYMNTSREKVTGADLTEFADAAVVELARKVVSGQTRTWMSTEVEHRHEHVNGVMRYSVRPLRQDDPGRAVIVVQDITQQRIAEESRNAFVTQVTHELRAPLTNIRLYAESAIEEGDDNPESRRRSLNVINQEARRLERIVGDMLSVAEIEAGKYQIRHDDVRIQALFEGLKDDYDPYAQEKGISLEIDLAPKLPVIQGDRDKIALAVHNLVGNAIKYTPADGRVGIRVAPQGSHIVVEVADTGIGIREDEQERVFEKFYRASDTRVSEVTGSGLGLALAREVIRMHGGDITVDSQVDHGSTFLLTLPVMGEAA